MPHRSNSEVNDKLMLSKACKTFDAEDHEEARRLSLELYQHADLPPLIRASICSMLATGKSGYVRYAEEALEEWQLMFDDEPDEMATTMLAEAHETLAHAKSDRRMNIDRRAALRAGNLAVKQKEEGGEVEGDAVDVTKLSVSETATVDAMPDIEVDDATIKESDDATSDEAALAAIAEQKMEQDAPEMGAVGKPAKSPAPAAESLT